MLEFRDFVHSYYCDVNETYLINGNEHISEFLPRSNDPKDLAKIIDRIVEDKDFRTQLQKKELEFVNKLTNKEKIASIWEKIFEESYKQTSNIHRKDSIIRLMILNFMAKIMENLIYKKRWKYKQV